MHKQTSVLREITEAEMVDTFTDYVRGLGIKPAGITVKFTEKKMTAAARSLKWRLFGVSGFKVIGTFIAQDGKLHFVLQGSSPAVPFTSFIAPRVDTIVAVLVEDLNVTHVDIREGKLVVTGSER